jgi:hypothetical protein
LVKLLFIGIYFNLTVIRELENCEGAFCYPVALTKYHYSRII